MNGIKFWTFQKKIYAIATTVIVIGGASAYVTAQVKKIEKNIDAHIVCLADSVAKKRDSITEAKRNPLDSLILNRLDGIIMEQKKTAFILEKNTNRSAWNKTEAAWRSDSLFNARYPTK